MNFTETKILGHQRMTILELVDEADGRFGTFRHWNWKNPTVGGVWILTV